MEPLKVNIYHKGVKVGERIISITNLSITPGQEAMINNVEFSILKPMDFISKFQYADSK